MSIARRGRDVPKLRFQIEVEITGEGDDLDCAISTCYTTADEPMSWTQVIIGMAAAGGSLIQESQKLLLEPERRKEAMRRPN